MDTGYRANPIVERREQAADGLHLRLPLCFIPPE